ncbi:endogenous retrovirus group K member 8 Pro protein-like protein [Willisornis vidua]|uniref:Endogenous retrovirus group K member 8 Pro protein-like protein n=1 Tax=Willisornis vidua TaxID=1566151 RepID=A0ABQ9CP03_9PASS|nr:endogenous retrovirus group K member 8 Pro protein-like protein [Willisornis vidua]
MLTTTSDEPLSVGEDYLVLPASEASLRGIIVQPSLISPDIDDNLKTNAMPLSFRVLLPPIEVSSQDPVAVLLLTTQLQHQRKTTKAVNWTTTLTDDQPMLSVTVALPLGQTSIKGLLDTGADVTIISVRDWPDAWPEEGTIMNVTGVGGTLKPKRSKHILTFTDPDKNVASCRPLILPLPTTLWGRDILGQWGTKLKTNL